MSSLNKGLIFHAPLSEKYEKVGSELVTNGDFSDYTGTIDDSNEDTFSGWGLDEFSGDAEFYAVSDAPDEYSTALKYVQATAPDENWHHRPYQHFTYTSGKKYKVVFWAKASASRELPVRDRGNSTGGLSAAVSLTTEWQKFEIYFTANDNSNGIYFFLGGDSPDVYITGVSVKEVQTADITPNRNHGVVYGASYTTGRTGKENDAMNFDGVDDYIEAPNSESLNITEEITISAWVKPEKVDEARIVRKSTASGASQAYALLLDPNNYVWFYIYDNTATGHHDVKSTTALETNKWYYVAGVFDGRYMKVYVNGTLERTLDIGEITTIRLNSDPLTIGGTYRIFDGAIGEVRIYNRALSEIEIKQLYYSYKPSGGINTGKLNKGLILDMPLKSKNEKVGEELITNGNFESDTSGWSGWNVTLEHETTDTYHGSGALKTTAATEGGNVYQNNISFVSGKTYRICFAHKNLSGTGGGFFIHKQSDGTLLHTVLNYSAESSWTYHVVDVVATYTGNVQIRLTQHNGSVDLYDNISIKELKTADNTPNSNHGTVYGASVSEDYTSFDGTDDYIQLNKTVPLGYKDLTVAFWVYDKSSDFHRYVNLGGRDVYIVGCSFLKNDSDDLVVQIADGVDSRPNVISYNFDSYLNRWTFVCFVIDRDDKIYLYIDGNLVSQAGLPGWVATIDLTPDVDECVIGRKGKISQQYHEGYLSNIKIWDRILSEEEVKLLYEKGR